VVCAQFGAEHLFLLLRRIPEHGGFWQSVTGSLEVDETHRQAALREVYEETGFNAEDSQLIDLGLINTFEISPQWLPKYAPGVTHNEEVCFGLLITRQEPVLDSREHDAFLWVSYDEATALLYWESNRRALEVAKTRLVEDSGSGG